MLVFVSAYSSEHFVELGKKKGSTDLKDIDLIYKGLVLTKVSLKFR